MQIFLSKNCLALQGVIGRDYGYFIVKRGKSFFSQRSKHSVPPDGHWRFIVLCAELAHNGLYIKDISVTRSELHEALTEARRVLAAQCLRLPVYHARDILNLKTTFGL